MTSPEQQQQQQQQLPQSRIPLALQSIFVASNGGADVHVPPPSADQVYEARTQTVSYERRAGQKVYKAHRDKVLSVNKSKKSARQYEQEQQEKAKHMAERKALAWKIGKEIQDFTLQEYFDALLAERGYKVEPISTLTTAYYSKPTPLQVASYGPRMVQIIKAADSAALKETLQYAGLSPNPCNTFGESLLHMACRRGDEQLLQVFLDAGAVLQVCDDYGRTVLHDACWAAHPCFAVVSQILKHDNWMFFLRDKRGSLPLSYVPKADWNVWKDWLDAHVDEFYPESHAEIFVPSDLCAMPPNSFPVADGKQDCAGLTLELIQMVANGDLSPREARVAAETAVRGDDDATVAMTVMTRSTAASGADSTFYDGSDDDSSDWDTDSDDDSLGSYDSAYDQDVADMKEFGIEMDGAMMEMLSLAQRHR